MWTFLIAISLLLLALAKYEHQGMGYLLSHYLILCLAILVCASGLIVHYAYNIGNYFRKVSRLRHLANDEKEVLARFVKEGASSLPFYFDKPAPNSLVDDGVLRIASETGRVHQDVGCTYYTIGALDLRILRKNPSYTKL